LRLARRKRWNLLEEKRITQEVELQSYLNRLIKDDFERKAEKLKLDEALSEDAQKEAISEAEQQSVNVFKLAICCVLY
jgi:STIP1 homology and U-box containing protein 1